MNLNDVLDICWPDVICEFVNIVFHQILYIKNVYPKNMFIKVKNYNIPLYKCNDNEVNAYLNEVGKAVRKMLEENSLETISLIIYGYLLEDNNKIPLETIMIEVGGCNKEKLNFSLVNDQSEINNFQSVLERLEQQFRDFILLLLVSDYNRYHNYDQMPLYCSTPKSGRPSTSLAPQNILSISEICKLNLRSFEIHANIKDTLTKSLNKKSKNKKMKYVEQSLMTKLQSNLEFPWIITDTSKSLNLSNILNNTNTVFSEIIDRNLSVDDIKISDTIMYPIKHIDTPFVNIQAYMTQNLYICNI